MGRARWMSKGKKTERKADKGRSKGRRLARAGKKRPTDENVEALPKR
jgi:hypothetical protein